MQAQGARHRFRSLVAEAEKDVQTLASRSQEDENQSKSTDLQTEPQLFGIPLWCFLFGSLLVVRICSAYWCPIADCDETYNYWEPTHYLLHGFALQTWEYSPAYAIRSYAYLLPHAAVGWAAALLGVHKESVFFVVRGSLGCLSACAETRLLLSVRGAFGAQVQLVTWLLLLTSAGMAHAAVSFVPSSFSMSALAVAYAFWLHAAAAGEGGIATAGAAALGRRAAHPAAQARKARRSFACAIAAVACAVLLGWPFAALLGLPLAIDALLRAGARHFITCSLTAGAALVVPMALIDSYFYGRFVVAPLNIVLYNASPSEGSGAQLYGTEPWHFYILNLALNFNLALPAALCCLPALAARALVAGAANRAGAWLPAPLGVPSRSVVLLLCGAPLWLGFFSAIPHKEERFMYPIYPQLCLSAALALAAMKDVADIAIGRLLSRAPPCSTPRTVPPSSTPNAATAAQTQRTASSTLASACCSLPSAATCAALALCCAVALARVCALIVYYGAPLAIATDLAQRLRAQASASGSPSRRVCFGKEWYRAPGSFFMPSSEFSVSFVEAGFDGLLPSPFVAAAPAGSRAVPTHFNDQNRAVAEQFMPLLACEWLVDLQLPGDAGPVGFKEDEWTVLQSMPFLDTAASPRWSRALFLPGLSFKYNVFANYTVFHRKSAQLHLQAP